MDTDSRFRELILSRYKGKQSKRFKVLACANMANGIHANTLFWSEGFDSQQDAERWGYLYSRYVHHPSSGYIEWYAIASEWK